MGEEVVEAVNYAGFTATRIFDAMFNEAVRSIMDGNKPEEIDRAMKVYLAGVDIVLHGLEIMEKNSSDRDYPPPPFCQMSRAGHQGRKTRKGFYNY